jgi:hypothetical protein
MTQLDAYAFLLFADLQRYAGHRRMLYASISRFAIATS